MKFIFSLFLTLILNFSCTACNVFSPIDPPSGDTQTLSAARDALDRGDYASASKYYGNLSSITSDVINSEEAFAILSENGMTISVFMYTVILDSTSSGKLVTHLAQALLPIAKVGTRLNIFHAYQKINVINNLLLRGLIRFITSLSLTAELLAENSSSSTKILQSDIVVNPNQCLSSYPLFASSPGCLKPSSSHFISGSSAITLPSASDSQMSGTASLQMIYASLTEIINGVTELGNSTSLGNASTSFAASILTNIVLPDPNTSPAFRGGLVLYGIGE